MPDVWPMGLLNAAGLGCSPTPRRRRAKQAGCLLVAGLTALSLPGGAPAQPLTEASPPAKAVTLDTDPHLVGWWRLDETSGQTAADSSGHGHHGTLEGSLTFETHSAPGRSGRAIRLDGNADCVRVPGFKGVTGTRARTVAAWIKTAQRNGEIASWGRNEHGQMFVFGHIRGRIGVTPKGGYLYMKAATDDDAWHHVAVVVQQGSPPNLHDHVKLFKDGELAEIDDIGLLDLWPIETGADQEVCLGRGFKGLLDEVRLYDRALSEEEIKALFKLETDRPLTNRDSKSK